MKSQIDIKILVEPDISEEFDTAIRDLQTRAFPECELFRESRFYVHKPRQGDLRVLAMAGERLAAQVVAYQAAAQSESGEILLACFGNVCSDPELRGCGVASECMTAAIDNCRWAERQWAMLFCTEGVADYYRRWGFECVNNQLFVTAPGDEPRKYPKGDLSMVMPLAGQKMTDWPGGKLVLDIDVF